jgi:hypothetical protein
VLSIEALDDDTKLVVRSSTSARKTLRAKFAGWSRAMKSNGSVYVAVVFAALIGYFSYQWWFNPSRR